MEKRWTSWKSLGKPQNLNRFKAMALGKNQNGSLAIFAGTDDGLWNRAELGNEHWSDWQKVNDEPIGINFHDLCVANNADGRMALFTISQFNGQGNSSLFTLAQNQPNGSWGRWLNLGAPVDPGNFFLHKNTRKRLAIGKNADGRLEIFALHFGFDGNNPSAVVWQKWQTIPNGDWSHWKDLGAIPARTSKWPFNIKVVSNQDGRQELFMVGEKVGLWHIWQTAPNSGWGCWRDEEQHTWDQIALGNNQDGRLHLLVTNGSGKVVQTFQLHPNGGWSEWQDIPGPTEVQLGLIAAEKSKDGRLALFAKEGKDDRPSFFFTQQVDPGSESWTEWISLGSPDTGMRISSNPNLSDLVVGNNLDSNLQLMVADEKGEIWTIAEKNIES